MGANVTQVGGATQIELYFRNYTYATALSDLNDLEMVLFTDLDRLGYKNASSSLRKLLEDASGSSNITEGCILYADANGRATFNANFKIDGSGYIELPEFPYGWSFNGTATTFEIYKDGSPIGVVLAGV